mgnify:CR=1 FL=1
MEQARPNPVLLAMTEGKPDEPLARLRVYQAILMDFTRMANEARDLGRLLQIAAVQAGRGLGIRHTKIARYRPEQGDLLIEAGVGWRPGVVGLASMGADPASHAGRALLTRETVVVDDAPSSREFRYDAVLREHGIVSIMNAPIGGDGDIWGVIEVDSETPRHFAQDDIQFLTTMGHVLAATLHRMAVERAAADARAAAARAMAGHRTLVQELVHRSKNDFQLIMSLLSVQMTRMPEESRPLLLHVMDRVGAISMAHDQLSARSATGSLDMSEYLEALCSNLRKRRDDVTITSAVAPAVLPHARAVALGLVVNETVINAIKHAFPDRPGTISVTFRTDEAMGEGILTILDDGVGMGPSRPGSSGLKIVRGLVRQLGGQVSHEGSSAGTTVTVRFPLVI